MVVYVEVIGYIGSFVLSFMAIPQIYNIWRTKSAKDLSYGMLAMLMIGYILFLTYGVLIWSIPIVTSIAFSITNCSIMIALKWKYDKVAILG
jgi:MtN3 and saliva related transmembrane protein